MLRKVVTKKVPDIKRFSLGVPFLRRQLHEIKEIGLISLEKMLAWSNELSRYLLFNNKVIIFNIV